VFTSPNPNQVPLPNVISSQPAPDPAKADLSLRLSVDRHAPAVNEVLTYNLIITNQGGLAATGVNVDAYLPAGQTFVPGNDMNMVNGTLVRSVSDIAAGSSISLVFRAMATASGQGICTSQITSSGVADPDSTPGNGTSNGEDDTAQVDVRVR